MADSFDMGSIDMAWCPGCGNFTIHKVLKETLTELEIKPQDTVIVSGIGQAAKMPHYLRCHAFNGLHGRALPPATAIKAVNPNLLVIAESGDGDMYGEGGNHFLHTIRRNPDIVNIVHNNMVYGLTKGQASPTSRPGFQTPVQVDGVILQPFNPIAVAVALNASFAARTCTVDPDGMKAIFKKAITHKGYALVDVLHPCVSFNKVNTFKWFKENSYSLEAGYKPDDRLAAFERACEQDKLPLGIFYVNSRIPPFGEQLSAYRDNDRPLTERPWDMKPLEKLMAAKAEA